MNQPYEPDELELLDEPSISIEDFDLGLEAVYYDNFYRQRGIRRNTMFGLPKFSHLEQFELPRSGIVHYIPESSVELGPAPNHVLLRKAPGMILAEHVTELAARNGAPIRAHVTAEKLIQQYRTQYRRIRPLRNFENALRDDRTIIIQNYSMLNLLVKYRNMPMTRYHKFINMWETVVKRINEVSEKSDWHQYIMLTVPKKIPTKAAFVRGTGGLSRQVLGLFPDDASLFLLEMWKWLGPRRVLSVLNGLTPKSIEKLNFVVVESGKFTMFNLGLLNSWRKALPNEAGAEDSKATGYDPKQMQLLFLRFLDAVFTIKSVAPKTMVETDQPLVDDSDAEPDSSVVAIVNDGEEMEELERLEAEAANTPFEEDTQQQFIPVVEEDELPDVPKDPEEFSDGVMQASEKLLEEGLISNAEHRRFERLGSSYADIPNPVGEGSLQDLLKIDANVINNIPKAKIPEIGTVLDKSMLDSTLTAFDPVYIEKVLHADIANMVVAAQNAGIAVTDYKVDTYKDINNEFETHTVKFVPVGGAPSTFRFKMPVVRKDGSFLAQGTKYRMRKQRGDLPIRKISPSRVGLSTYYSKLFVTRSEKKVNDYGKWLLSQVQLVIEAGSSIKDVVYGNVFNHEIKTPRPFSIMASRYKSTTITGADDTYHFVWDYSELIKQYDAKLVNRYIKGGDIPCGTDSKGTMLLMSNTGVVYYPEGNKVIGSLEELIGLDSQKAPIEAAELNVMGKNIPLGLVLAYYYGISKLLRKLGANYRMVARGSRLDLDSDEYAIKFADQSLVMSRQDRLATLVIGSLDNFHKSMAAFNFDEFNQKDVYGAILDREGFGVRYVRELELMQSMYIDHISRELLQAMKEPTEFAPLLLRAADLLTTDDHPEEIDGKYRRIKGYERLSGHVYSEMVRGIRMWKSRPVTAKAQVEINPNAVWMAIQQDPSVTIVDEINPIHNLKEKENVTFGGTGGRSGRTMVRRTRAFHKNDLGTISEATVDNSDVAVTTYLSANPKLATLRGVGQDWEFDPSETASILSTSALISPCSTHEDYYGPAI